MGSFNIEFYESGEVNYFWDDEGVIPFDDFDTLKFLCHAMPGIMFRMVLNKPFYSTYVDIAIVKK